MKIAPILEEIGRRPAFSARLIHTGQHYSADMSASFFRDLGIPEPDINLESGGGTQTSQTASIMLRLEDEFTAHRPDLLVVVGDVNSTMAATLVAAKLGIRIAHVEAGLRSFDRAMPEEINRLVTDVLSDYLFVSEPSGVANLLAEGVPSARISLVGNVMIDTLLKFRERARESAILETLGLSSGGYAVLTLHRPSNVDDPGRLAGLIGAMAEVAKRLPVVFPCHPRTRQRLDALGLPPHGLLLTEPLGYLEFLRLMSEARLVMTDSGGIQEETSILNVQCLTLRDNTERPATIASGANRLVGSDPGEALRVALEVLAAPAPRFGPGPDLWDGKASSRILDVLEQKFA
jgi:UDP-N-acetylglucosamine 2-epimerase (non-hydrolysing)